MGTMHATPEQIMSVSGNLNTAATLSAQIQASTLCRTLSGIVRSELPAIEAALRHGLRYEQLCQHLAALGVKVSPGTLRQTVYRLRHEVRRAHTLGDPAAQPSPAEAPMASPASPPQHASAGKQEPGPGPEDSAFMDKVPLLEVKADRPPADQVPTDFITAIRQSSPDLDVLAYRYRQAQQRERSAAGPASQPSTLGSAASADLTSTRLTTGSPSS